MSESIAVRLQQRLTIEQSHSRGFEQVSNVVGGMAAWSAAKLPVAQ